MQAAAFLILVLAGFWLAGIALLMALRPHRALALLAGMSVSLKARSWRVQLTEQGLRLLAGVALVIRAPVSKWPAGFEAAGWVIVVTSAIILILPLRWHGAYGGWWAERIHPLAVRLLSPVPLATGLDLVYLAY